jgi:iron complex transport system substrate-binding protein
MIYVKGRLRCISVVLLLAAVFTVNGAPRKDAAATGPAAGRVFVDSAGREVELPGKISRIVPSGPLAQMFLLAIAPDMVCAISSAYNPDELAFVPASFAELPVVGQFYGAANLNPEEIARIGPDLVIDIGEPKDTIAWDMDNISASVGVPAVHVTATLWSTAQAFRTLGQLLDREAQGEALARFCEKTLASGEAVMERVGERKKSVLYCLGKAGLNVLAKGSFHTEVLDWMADNRAVVATPTSRGSGNETNLEQLLLWDPEVILFGADSVYAAAAQDPTWRQLGAIRRGDYYEVPRAPANWVGSPPSTNRFLGVLWLGVVLYPEYVGYDLYAETAEYYRLFYGHELSREGFRRITAGGLGG